MGNKKVFLMLMTAFVASFQVNGQDCKDIFIKANEYYKNGNLEKAKSQYQKVINCGDQVFLNDCQKQIKLIDQLSYKPKKSAPFGVSNETVVIPYQGGDAVVTVEGGSSFKISLNSQWCTARKSGSKIIISSEENSEMKNRTAEIRVTSGTQYRTIVVTNEGSPEILRSSVANVTFPAQGETNSIDIFANTKWDIIEAPTWITANKESGKISLTATTNNANTSREANIKIQSPQNTIIIINIAQGAGKEQLLFSKNELSFGPNGGDEYIKVYTDASDWRFGDFPHWCQLTRIGEDSIKIHCAPNAPINEMREASINVTTGNQTLGINVSQEPKPMIAQIPNFGIGGRPISFGITAGYILPMVNASSGGEFTGSPVNYALGTKDENASYSSSGGFAIGLHADFRVYKNFYINAGLNYINYSYKNEFEEDVYRIIGQTDKYSLKGNTQNRYKEDYNFNTLEIPIIASYRLPITNISHIQFNVGPVISYGLSAKMKLSGNTDSQALYSYKIINHEVSNQRYDGYTYQMSYTGNGEMDLYNNNVDFYEIHSIGSNKENKKSTTFPASTFNRLNFGARIGVAYEYAGISLGIEYNFMLSNMANKKYWESDRWTIFDQTTNTIMSGYKQRNDYLQIKIGYTFRY